jgi:hypothetical protein
VRSSAQQQQQRASMKKALGSFLALHNAQKKRALPDLGSALSVDQRKILFLEFRKAFKSNFPRYAVSYSTFR